MVWIRARKRQGGGVAENATQRKYAGWSAPVSLHLLQTGFILTSDADPPREAVLSEKHTHWETHSSPLPTSALEPLDMADR